ncbi:MAG: helix-turn-helix domain-containing protein [Rhodobacteraceae bacterium]|nr:helix-turn-helix domain-containing protein [Paracoccaceae bacterium]
MSNLAMPSADLPAWLPEFTRVYLRHVSDGVPIRQLARDEGVHASTVMRRLRRIEQRRDDPLIDEALTRFAHSAGCPPRNHCFQKESSAMSAPIRNSVAATSEDILQREGRRILRRLSEPGALLVVAPDMDKAVVLKGTVRTAVLDRNVAQSFALKDWIAVAHTGRVTTYEITSAGRAALRRMLETDDDARSCGFAEAQAGFGMPFAGQHRDWETRDLPGSGGEGSRRMRLNLAESPLGVLARRRDKDGEPFLTQELVNAGERLREDFELAQLGPRVAQNWERFLSGGERGQYRPDAGQSGGSERARERVAAALRDLGPGLGDMALRCCCFLEGLEAAEKRLGWSARSGKIVLRIALMRLKRHYEETYGKQSPLIG